MALTIAAQVRPFALLAPGARTVPLEEARAGVPTPVPAPFVGAEVSLCADAGRLVLELASGGVRLSGEYDARRAVARLHVTDAAGRTTRHRSLRGGRATGEVTAVALTLTGTWLTIWTCGVEESDWTARSRVTLADRVDTRSEELMAGLRLRVGGDAPIGDVRVGAFGQLGLRDIRLVSEADGSPIRRGGRLLLSATSAGPGFFDTGHTSIWSLDEASFDLRHEADLFFRRPDRPGVFGDHACHVVRDGERWLVATSTWGDFDGGKRSAVASTLAETTADVTTGTHVLDTRPLHLPTDGLTSVGVWDPHLVRVDGPAPGTQEWLVGFVSATRYFEFHPVLASGPTLESLTMRSAATGRVATEGTTLVRLDDGWRVVASDGKDSAVPLRERFPVFDLDLTEVATIAAPYPQPTNLPWPTLVRTDSGWLMTTFNGRPRGGRLLGYGTHGDVVVLTGHDLG